MKPTPKKYLWIIGTTGLVGYAANSTPLSDALPAPIPQLNTLAFWNKNKPTPTPTPTPTPKSAHAPSRTPAPSPTPSVAPALPASVTTFLPCSANTGIATNSNGQNIDSGQTCVIQDYQNASTNFNLQPGQAWASQQAFTYQGQSYQYAVLKLQYDGNLVHYAVKDFNSLANDGSAGWQVLDSSLTASGDFANGGFPLGISFVTGQNTLIPATIGHNLNGLLKQQQQNSFGSAWCGIHGDSCYTNNYYGNSSNLTFINGRLQYRLYGGIFNGSVIAYLTSAAYKNNTDSAWNSGDLPQVIYNFSSSNSTNYKLNITSDILISWSQDGANYTAIWSTNIFQSLASNSNLF